MIELKNKLDLEKRVVKLKSKVKDVNEDRMGDSNYLTLWNIYHNFISNILYEFPIYNAMKEIKPENIEIYELLEVEKFNVSVKCDFDEQKKQLNDYVDRILEKLKG